MGVVANAAGLAVNTQFRNMALVSLVYTANTVLAEDPATANHDRRVWLARQVIATPASYADSIAWAMAADPTISQAATVAQVDENVLLTRVAAAWNSLAGTGVVTVH